MHIPSSENQLIEAGDFMKYKLAEFDACTSGTHFFSSYFTVPPPP